MAAAAVIPCNCQKPMSESPLLHQSQTPNSILLISSSPRIGFRTGSSCVAITTLRPRRRRSSPIPIFCKLDEPNSNQDETNLNVQEAEDVNSLGVKAALSMLRFYKREISPLLPKSCRYVPTCSEYSMEAYKKYGVVKGTILTAWRLCRCNPLGGSGFDPPRWFDEEPPPQE